MDAHAESARVSEDFRLGRCTEPDTDTPLAPVVAAAALAGIVTGVVISSGSSPVIQPEDNGDIKEWRVR